MTTKLTREQLIERIDELEKRERKMIMLNAELALDNEYLKTRLKRIKIDVKNITKY